MFSRYRTLVAWTEAVLVIGLPFLTINGQSVIRFDIPTLRLFLCGTVIKITEFYLVLLIVVFFFILIISVTAIFGRLWCGWLCPQTVILDLAGSLHNTLQKKIPEWMILLLLSAVVSASVVWYFVPPEEMLASIPHSKVITGFFVVIWITLFLELSFLGRRFCKYICPYSMLQTALFDQDTLVIKFTARNREFKNEKGCLMCERCVKICPMAIDIRDGLQRECIACAGCIDACRDITIPRKIKPFIAYTGNVLRRKALYLGILTILSGAALIAAFVSRPPVEFVIKRQQIHTPTQYNQYQFRISNLTGRAMRLYLELEGAFEMKGPRIINLKPYQDRIGYIVIKSLKHSPEPFVTVVVRGENFVLKRRVGYL